MAIQWVDTCHSSSSGSYFKTPILTTALYYQPPPESHILCNIRKKQTTFILISFYLDFKVFLSNLNEIYPLVSFFCFCFFHFFHWWNLFKFYLFLFSLTFDDHAYIPKCRLYIFTCATNSRYNIQNNEIKKKKVRNRGEGTIYKGAIISNISFYIPWRLLTSFLFSIGTHPRRHLFLSNFFFFFFFFIVATK